MNDNLLQLVKIGKTYHQADEDLVVLHDVDLQVRSGETVALVGPSGSGKSTLLQIAGLLDRSSHGKILIEGRDVSHLNDVKRTKLRRHFIGFVYQFHYLLPEFSAVENIVIPQMVAGVARKEARERALHLLDRMGLSHRAEHRPARMSGGEQQRVAIARALANKPRLLLADEPTGNLDPETSEKVFEMLIELVQSEGVGALIATHNLDLADEMDRILTVRSGTVEKTF